MDLINNATVLSSDYDDVDEASNAAVSLPDVELDGVCELSTSAVKSSNEVIDINCKMPHHVCAEHCNDDEGSLFVDSDSSVSTDDQPNESAELQSDLAKWAVENKLPHLAIGGLLGILRKWFSDLPKDPRTLLCTDTTVVSRPIAGGVYSHLMD